MRALLAILLASPALADPAEIVTAEAAREGATWRVTVTLRHADTGWDDYANGWRVWADGEEVGTRELLHPMWQSSPSRGRWAAW